MKGRLAARSRRWATSARRRLGQGAASALRASARRACASRRARRARRLSVPFPTARWHPARCGTTPTMRCL